MRVETVYAIAFASQSYIGLVLITGGIIAQLIGKEVYQPNQGHISISLTVAAIATKN